MTAAIGRTVKSVSTGQIDAIAGLRALAVLSVVLFHIDPSWMPGGFVGVDIFFVISGFVVAHSVYRVEPVSIGGYFLWFYRRRFLRILPAIFLYVVIVGLLGALFIPASEASKFIEVTGAASLFGASNFVLLWKAGDYFAASAEYNSFTHTWSLAVEEQYYFLFPLFSYVLIVKTWAKPHVRRAMALSLWGACLISLFACAYVTMRWRTFAFFMLPTRFWELGIGFMLRYHGAALFGRQAMRPSPVVSALSTIFLISLLGSVWWTPSDGFPFPGALWPCLTTAALIAIVWLVPNGWLSRLLATAPFRFFGNLSYSLYLWHWGVVVLMRWTVGIDTLPLRLLALTLMIVLALGSYHLVERRLRYDGRLAALGTWTFFGGYALTAAAIGALCLGLFLAKPRIGLSASNDVLVWSPYVERPEVPGACHVDDRTTGFGAGWVIDSTPRCKDVSRHRLFVIGDSHAGAYERMLHLVAAAEPMTVRTYTAGGCRLIQVDEAPSPPQCATFLAKAQAAILAVARSDDILFLPGYYTPRYRDTWGAELTPNDKLDRRPLVASRAAIQSSAATLRVFLDRGLHIIVEAPKPTIPTALFRCADWFNRSSRYCAAGWSISRTEMEMRRARPLAALQAIVAAAPDSVLWDPFPILCTAHRCGGFRDGKPLYADTDHLSGYGNELLFPSFRTTLDSVRSRPPQTADRPAVDVGSQGRQ